MANMPRYNTRNFSFGAGVLYIAPYDIENDKPVYPYIDIGAVNPGSVLRINREILDVRQGTPDVIVKSYVRSESVEFSLPSIEWNLENIKRVLGGGQYDAVLNKLKFGGSMDLDVYSLMFVHEMPSGDIIKINIWKANPTGSIEINFGNDNVHQFELNFRALNSFYGWDERVVKISDNNSGDNKFTATINAGADILPGSVWFDLKYKDDAQGHLLYGDSTVGTINYSTGEIEINIPDYDGLTDIPVTYATLTVLPETASMVEIFKIERS